MPIEPEISSEEYRNDYLRLREQKIAPLRFEPDIIRLLDTEGCHHLSSQLDQDGVKWERRNAVSSLAGQLPDSRGLYMFVWAPGIRFHLAHHSAPTHDLTWVLYVGKAGTLGGRSDTLRSRYAAEYSKFVGRSPSRLWSPDEPAGRSDRLARFLALRPLEYWFIELKDVQMIEVLEKSLISHIRPPLNKQTGPRARLGNSTPAF